MKPVYALSIKQPWAWLIVQGLKDVENRTWWPPKAMIGQRIYIHAGLTQDYTAYEGGAASRWLRKDIRERIGIEASFDWDVASNSPSFLLGRIVGEATLWAVAGQWKLSPWFEGPVGFLLKEPVAFERPIPYKGALGFFKVLL